MPVAARGLIQLAAWEELAAGWAVTDDGPVRRCATCRGGILLLADQHGTPYTYPDGQELALTVLHLRAWHAALDPDRPAGC